MRRRSRRPRPRGCAHAAPRARRRPRGRPGEPRSRPTARPLPCRSAPRSSRSAVRHRGPSASIWRTSFLIAEASGWSALLIAITSGISMIPAFSACTASPEPGISTSTTVSAAVATPISFWPGADRLDEDDVLPGGVEDEHGLQRRLGEAARVAAGAHRADEHAGVEEVLGEPDPVAEERAAGERARRVDRDHARPSSPRRAHVGDERRDQARLADAGSSGEADDAGAAGAAVEQADELAGRADRRSRRARSRGRARASRPPRRPPRARGRLRRPVIPEAAGSSSASIPRVRRSATSVATRMAALATPKAQRGP